MAFVIRFKLRWTFCMQSNSLCQKWSVIYTQTLCVLVRQKSIWPDPQTALAAAFREEEPWLSSTNLWNIQTPHSELPSVQRKPIFPAYTQVFFNPKLMVLRIGWSTGWQVKWQLTHPMNHFLGKMEKLDCFWGPGAMLLGAVWSW